MLHQKYEIISSDLVAHAPLLALLTNGVNSIRPLIAEVEDGDAFVTFNIRFNGYATKANIAQLQVVVQSWAKTLSASLTIADEVTKAFEASDKLYVYESATPTFNEQQEIYTEQIFTIKN